MLSDFFYYKIKESILKQKVDYSNQWNKKQAKISENLPFKIMKQILGQHEQMKNFYYKVEDKNNPWCECDGVILFEGWLIVIEVKSGRRSYKSPAQNVVSHFESIKKLLIEPAEQGQRFMKALKKNRTLNLYDKNQRFLKTIDIKDFKETLIMAVSLEQFTDFFHSNPISTLWKLWN